MSSIKIDLTEATTSQRGHLCDFMERNFDRQYSHNPESKRYPRQIARCREIKEGKENVIFITEAQFKFMETNEFFASVCNKFATITVED